MKEPITGRDLFVISAMCTGFGVLLAWGLFYRWGSAPSVKQIDLSGWIQAIGTLIAVTIAIAVPHQVYAKERRERDIREAAERADRAETARLKSKALAAEFLPTAARFRTELRGLMADIADPDLEHYHDATTARFRSSIEELRKWAARAAEIQSAGEHAMDAISFAELAISTLSDWEFYEVHTWNGVIEDPERDIYEVFPQPDAPMPILRDCLTHIDDAIRLMNAMFR